MGTIVYDAHSEPLAVVVGSRRGRPFCEIVRILGAVIGSGPDDYLLSRPVKDGEALQLAEERRLQIIR